VTLQRVLAQMASTVRTGGVAGLWRGNGAAAIRVFPYAAVQLATNDIVTSRLLTRRRAAAGARGQDPALERLGALERVLAGATAGVASVVTTYPLDLVRARLAVQAPRPSAEAIEAGHAYRGTAHAISSIVRHEGAAGLFRGAPATVVGIVPYAATSFGVFSSLKARLRQRTGREPTTLERMGCGALAGLLGQTVGYPLDVVRRRQQTAHFLRQAGESGGPAVAGAGSSTESMVTTARLIVRLEGWGALWKGVSINWIKGPVAVSVSFVAFDTFKQWAGVVDAEERG